MTADAERRGLRREMTALRDGLSDDYRRAQSNAIERIVLTSRLWQDADSVFMYCSVGSEVSTRGLMRHALAQGRALYLPRCEGRGVMHAVRVRSLDALQPGRYGIPEPTGCELMELRPDLCLAPGLAFDRCGGRIGYGGGYYDRFLGNWKPVTAALAYPCQLIGRVPVQAHDMPVDHIITSAGIMPCDERVLYL